MDALKQADLHQRMEQVLKEHDVIYQQHEQELMKYQEELRELEGELEKRKQELGVEEKKILAAKEALEQERDEIAKQQEALRQHREKISRELEEIRKEKLKHPLLEENRVPQVKMEVWEEKPLDIEPKEQQGREESKETELENAGQKESKVEETQEKIEIRQQTDVSLLQDRKASLNNLPGIIQQYAKTVPEFFPDGEVLEVTPEAYCMSIEDKELRIFAGSPPVAMILAKREKNSYLMKGITQLNKIQPDWEFTYEGNCLKCVMPFTEAIPAEVIVQKCAEAVAAYFK